MERTLLAYSACASISEICTGETLSQGGFHDFLASAIREKNNDKA